MDNGARQPGRAVQTRSTPLQQEIANHLAALHELGPEYTDSVAAALVDEMDQQIELKVRQVLAEGGVRQASTLHEKQKFVAMVLALGIPLLAIAGGIAGVFGIVLVVAAIGVLGTVAMTHNF